MADRTCPACLDPETIIPISRNTTAVFKTGSWTAVRPRFVEETSPCRVACPAGNDIVGAARAAARGDFDTALATFLEESPLPGVCGRVCYHPCQTACNLIGLGGAVNVRALERAAADHGQANPRLLSAAGCDKPVAVVGSGPAGLTCAYHLARLGHPVTLMEAAERAGGLTNHGIPGFRLPLEAVEKDLQRLWTLPVNLHTQRLVDEKTLAVLAAEHAAVFLSPGADAHLPLNLSGEELDGVVPGLAFLRSSTLKAKARDADVVVIGGGNTALDSALTALRCGARRVRVLYRRTRQQMSAFEDEVAEAEAEGVTIEMLVAPVAFVGGTGRLEAVRLAEMRLEAPGADGRLRPVPINEAPRELACDLAIVAAGQVPRAEPFLRELRWEQGRIWVDGWGRTSQPGWFAGGDLTPAQASVVDAIATGKRAALGIHLSLTGNQTDDALQAVTLGPGPAFSIAAWVERPPGWQPNQVARPDPNTLLFTPPKLPQQLPEEDPAVRVHSSVEVTKGLAPSQASEKADRCLCCGTCVGCDRCMTFCPEGVVIPPDQAGDGGTFDIGLQSLSGAADRNEDILYVCMDNEGYMNTGIQVSSATPQFTWTGTTPTGNTRRKKQIMEIMAAHRMPYAATASIAYPEDLTRTIHKAKAMRGTRFIHMLSPCTTGWKISDEMAVKVAMLSVETNIFPLYEIENGLKYTINHSSRNLPVEKYLMAQGRFKHLDPDQIRTIQAETDRAWDDLRGRAVNRKEKS